MGDYEMFLATLHESVTFDADTAACNFESFAARVTARGTHKFARVPPRGGRGYGLCGYHRAPDIIALKKPDSSKELQASFARRGGTPESRFQTHLSDERDCRLAGLCVRMMVNTVVHRER